MKTIFADERLAKGTRVQVKNRRGVVTRSELVNSYSGGKVAVNYVTFTHRFIRGFGAAGVWNQLPKQTKPAGVNYSFIQVL